MVAEKGHRTSDRFGVEQSPALRARELHRRADLSWIRAGEVGCTGSLRRSALAVAVDTLARVQPADRAGDGFNACFCPRHAPPTPQSAPVSVARSPRGSTGHAWILHERLCRSLGAPPSPDWLRETVHAETRRRGENRFPSRLRVSA